LNHQDLGIDRQTHNPEGPTIRTDGSAAIPASSRSSQPLKPNRQTFGPLPSPGTIGMRQLTFIKEIYFAMSELRLFSVLVRCF
jgi:hypothetical protein